MKKISIIFLLIILVGFNGLQAQSVRTFNNLELTIAPLKDNKQYSLFWGQSFQKTELIPFRFYSGLRYSFNTRSPGTYKGKPNSTISEVKFDKTIMYGTLALPIGIEVFYKNVGIGAFQELVSISDKNFRLDSLSASEGIQLKAPVFSSIFGPKKNLTNGAYLVLTFSDSFSVKAGLNNLSSTFIRSNEKRELGYTALSEETYYIGLRLNIEK